MHDSELGPPPGGPVPRGRRSAAAVPTDAVQHPLDRAALDALREVPGFDDVVRFVFEHGLEKVWRIQNLASAVRVSERQFPELWATYRGCAERLGVAPVPPLYLRPGGLNAFTSGVEEPFIVLQSATVSASTPAELEFVLGHELGHVRCQHVLYNTLAWQLPTLARLVPVVGGLVSRALAVALMEWHRRAELSCDRFGLLACQDPDAALRFMVKAAGAPYALYGQIAPDAFLAQYEDFSSLDRDALSYLYKILAELSLSHPWLVERAHLLHDWVGRGELEALLRDAPWEAPPGPGGAGPERAWPLPERRCAACGELLAVGVRFCEACGAPADHARLTRPCPGCGAPVGLGEGWCGHCGLAVGGPR